MPLRVTSNTAGQLYALTVLTPIAPGRLATLRAALDDLPKRPSPFARLAGTHFARFVVIDHFINDSGQPADEPLPSPYLLFSATFDGALDGFLDDLCDQLLVEAEAIWGNCVGAPQPARGPELKAYLKHNQLQTGLFFAAYPDADVATVRTALELRQKAIDMAVRSQAMTPEQLQQAFLREL